MNCIEIQLRQWASSVTRLRITPDIADKMGIFLDEALNNEKNIDVFLYTYTIDGLAVTGFLVAPKNIKVKLPVIIFNRGGTGDFGLIPQGQYFTRIARMAHWGYVVIGSYYPGNSYSEGIDERGGKSDIESVLYLHDLITYLDDADESNIGMYGESRGGMITYLCMRQVEWIKAAVTVGGSTNLIRSLEDRPELEQVFKKAFGNTKEGLLTRSAVKWTSKMSRNTPLCLLHGESDESVSPLDAIELANNLQKAKHPYSLHILKGGNHALTNCIEYRNQITKEWFERHLI